MFGRHLHFHLQMVVNRSSHHLMASGTLLEVMGINDEHGQYWALRLFI